MTVSPDHTPRRNRRGLSISSHVYSDLTLTLTLLRSLSSASYNRLRGGGPVLISRSFAASPHRRAAQVCSPVQYRYQLVSPTDRYEQVPTLLAVVRTSSSVLSKWRCSAAHGKGRQSTLEIGHGFSSYYHHHSSETTVGQAFHHGLYHLRHCDSDVRPVGKPLPLL